ncbi:UDP-N-acetylenolpyruvoylglucosamine reductase [Lacticaseibacillus thailandensis DSM 22698 = JCM 13996]|uniref:UDP-N-acetylenolpyruvoylglucosamine reductase n=2 Tax=Lacticaseibacillus thailandensis TaxID=381741 RepID=A0A0R2CIM1_9LACO|nr:UDP-N-acetylenolpyruvoylglucosamine reductase [Lacticaseibacillus thailandensis DSM 22698 = JCM 13996]
MDTRSRAPTNILETDVMMVSVATKTVAGLPVMVDEPLSNYTFTKTGGPADLLAFPETVAQVHALVDYAQIERIPLTVIGNASNLIVRDGGIRGLTMILTHMHDIQVTASGVTAAAGARIIDTADAAASAGLSGLEFAAGIPGSVGGAVFMNAGAYGGEVKDCLATVDVLTRDGQFKTYTNSQMDFAYRHSYVQQTEDIVLSATFALTPGDAQAIRARMDELNARRAAKQPLEYPSCGSVFRRPTGHYVGPMIQKAGLQGHIIGGAQISTKHAGFIVNIDHATATDYVDMIHYVQAHVDPMFNVDLQPEVRIIGSEPAHPEHHAGRDPE